MVTDLMIDELSIAQRDVLLLHIDGAVAIVRADSNRLKTLKKLISLRLLRYDPPAVTTRPQSAVLTDAGREALAKLLGRYADALVRAGYLDDEPGERPLQALRRLRAAARAARSGADPEQTALPSRNL